jgi:hypothetical protein
MQAEEKLKLDCEKTTKYFHSLADVRFKVLSLLPVVTGTAITLLQSQEPELVIRLSSVTTTY